MHQEIIQALTQDYCDEVETLNYYGEYRTNVLNADVFVEGLGQLHFPLSQTTIDQLLLLSEQAKFGLRSQTLTDKTVRDTQEISANALKVAFDDDFLASMLDEFKQQLALPTHATLVPHLHNLLIYKPGQFFKPHRDSEKLDGMIATMVIVLPSPHIGGALIINHKKEQHRFISENLNQTGLNCIAFYADCYHEVEKITQGYRIALTYNIVLESSDILNKSSENKALNTALKHYFELPEMSHADINLIYYLDHSYTEHSLRWDLLKGNDQPIANSFLLAAKKLDLVPHLALVEIQQAWSTDGDDDYPSLEELLDNSTCFNFWVDEHNRSQNYPDYRVCDEEICWLTATDDLEPDRKEHEGWTGNYGNTVDYWYRRAAIVLWPKQAQIRMMFRLNHATAMTKLFELIKKPGHEQAVLHLIQQANGYFHRSRHPSEEKPPIELYLQLAIYIQQAETALFVLNNYSLCSLNQTHDTWLFALQQQYGIDWCLSLLEQWKNNKTYHYYHDTLIENIGKLTNALIIQKVDTKIIEFLIEHQLNTLIKLGDQHKNARPITLQQSFPSRLNDLNDMLQAVFILNNDLFTQKLIDYVTSNSNLYPATQLAPLIITLQRTIDFKRATYLPLFTYVQTAVLQELSQGLRHEQDQSINQTLLCTCQYCQSATDFLKSPTERIKIWAVKQDIRGHIMSSLSNFDLPITCTEEKKGSPYKLNVVKSGQLYQIAKTRFEMLQTYKNALQSCIKTNS